MRHFSTFTALLITACTQTETEFTTTPDTVPPHVLNVSPAVGATGVPVNADVSAIFSETMDREHLVSSFGLIGPAGAVAGDAGVSADGQILTFTPEKALSAGIAYMASLSTSASDVAGNRLREQVAWTFTVEGTDSNTGLGGGGGGPGGGGGAPGGGSGAPGGGGGAPGGGSGAPGGGSGAPGGGGGAPGGGSGGLGGSGGTWTRQLGSIDGKTTANAVAIDSLGSVYVAGTTDRGLEGTTQAGTSDAFVVKFSHSGALLWVRQLGSSGADTLGNAIATDASGNVYVAGTTSGALGGTTKAGLKDAFLVKYGSDGAEQWARQVGSSGHETLGNALAVDSLGNPVVVGATSGALASRLSAGNSDIFLVKFNSAGERAWTEQFGSLLADEANAVATDASGNVLVAGAASGIILPSCPLLACLHAGASNLFVAKFDSEGTRLWAGELGSNKDDVAYALATNAAGDVLVVGSMAGASLDGNSNAGSPSSEAFIVRYDSAGQKLGTRLFGTPQNEVASAVSINAAGTVAIAGTTAGNLYGTVAGPNDGFIGTFSASAAPRAGHQFGSTGNDHVKGIATDATGNFFVVGGTTGALNGNSKTGTQDFFVAKFGPNGEPH